MEIGQRVTWTVRDNKYIGLFYENIADGFSKVKCLTQNNRPFIMDVNVLTHLLRISE